MLFDRKFWLAKTFGNKFFKIKSDPADKLRENFNWATFGMWETVHQILGRQSIKILLTM